MNPSISYIPDKEAVIDFGGFAQFNLKQPKEYLKRVRGNGIVISLTLATFFFVRPLVSIYFKRYYNPDGSIHIPLSKYPRVQQVYLNWKKHLDKVQKEKGEDYLKEFEDEMKAFSTQKTSVLQDIDLKGLSFLKRLLVKQIVIAALPYFKFSVDVYLHFKEVNNIPDGECFKTVPTEELISKRPASHEYLV